MSGWNNLCVFILIVVKAVEEVKASDSWELHRYCNRQVLTYGGVLTFDSNKLAGSFCQLTLMANGTGTTALSVYFTDFDVTPGCPANFTLIEDTSYTTIRTDPPAGLHQTFCKNDPYLNENLMYTTNGPHLSLVYKKADSTTHPGAPKPRMTFTLKITTFKAGVIGCSEQEEEHENMITCLTGRCIHRSLLCKELNPCGDWSDCTNSTGPVVTAAHEDSGGFYIRYLVLVFVAIFLLFASIQVCLLVRRRRLNPCHKKASSKPRARLQAEHIQIGNNFEVVTNGSAKKYHDSESLIEYPLEK